VAVCTTYTLYASLTLLCLLITVLCNCTATGNLVAQKHGSDKSVVMAHGANWRRGDLNAAQVFTRFVGYKISGVLPDPIADLKDCTDCTFGIGPNER
jgi:hypothetical protein